MDEDAALVPGLPSDTVPVRADADAPSPAEVADSRPLSVLPGSTRSSLWLFLAAVIVLSVVRLSPQHHVEGMAGLGYLTELVVAGIAAAVFAFLSLVAGAVSLRLSAQALLWMVPTALLLLLALPLAVTWLMFFS